MGSYFPVLYSLEHGLHENPLITVTELLFCTRWTDSMNVLPKKVLATSFFDMIV